METEKTVDTIDRRIKINFRTLNERQENEIICSLMDFLAWYKNNEQIVNKTIKQQNKKVDDISLVDFWIENIGKSEQIEEFLKDINVVADCYEYVKRYKKMILLLKDYPEQWVCTKNHYRTKEQAEELRRLFAKMKNHPEVEKIIEYLKKHGMDEDHISAEYAERIIQKCRQLEKRQQGI